MLYYEQKFAGSFVTIILSTVYICDWFNNDKSKKFTIKACTVAVTIAAASLGQLLAYLHEKTPI